MAKSWRRRSRFQNKKFRPYAVAIGQMNMAWNEFHEVLGSLFMNIMAEGHGQTDHKLLLRTLLRSRILWGHLTGDRQKRLLVEALAEWLGKERNEAFPTLGSDLLFLVKWGHKLEDKRNNVIHAPVDLIRNALAQGLPDAAPYGSIVAAPLNVRGRKLEGPSKRRDRELIVAARLYCDYATALTSYAQAVRAAWVAGETGRRRAWPQRPTLPRLRDQD
jgi:hypothetical protein